jgi:hypothetical protein
MANKKQEKEPKNLSQVIDPFYIPNKLRLDIDGNLSMVDGSSVQEYMKAFYTRCNKGQVMCPLLKVNIVTHDHYSHIRMIADSHGA